MKRSVEGIKRGIGEKIESHDYPAIKSFPAPEELKINLTGQQKHVMSLRIEQHWLNVTNYGAQSTIRRSALGRRKS